ncbi:pyridoxal 5'-phosphate synthase lyase subunit PdxS [Candidatus Woesearchaeota archaeon]|nr:pyridoxal 5'-phosphate synthase lyase subunit PdxS [Candidatus Woesearchaeota archaeon]
MSKKYSKENIEKLLESFAGGVIMDVTKGADAYTAQEAGAVAVMALYKVQADIRKEGGVARTASVEKIEEIVKSVRIPVMAKARIGHYGEARMLEALGIDFIDESEVLTPADKKYHINKREFNAPFVCGARDLGEALRRIYEGAMMIRTKGEAGTGDVNQAIEHMRLIREELAYLVGLFEYGKFLSKKGMKNMEDELRKKAQEYRVPYELVYKVAKEKKLPVLNFAAGGIATPADAAYMMELGADGVFVGSGIFKLKDKDQEPMARAIVEAVRYWNKPATLLEASRTVGEAMAGTAIDSLEEKDKTQYR